ATLAGRGQGGRGRLRRTGETGCADQLVAPRLAVGFVVRDGAVGDVGGSAEIDPQATADRCQPVLDRHRVQVQLSPGEDLERPVDATGVDGGTVTGDADVARHVEIPGGGRVLAGPYAGQEVGHVIAEVHVDVAGQRVGFLDCG